jgi:hypothetical protein
MVHILTPGLSWSSSTGVHKLSLHCFLSLGSWEPTQFICSHFPPTQGNSIGWKPRDGDRGCSEAGGRSVWGTVKHQYLVSATTSHGCHFQAPTSFNSNFCFPAGILLSGWGLASWASGQKMDLAMMLVNGWGIVSSIKQCCNYSHLRNWFSS